MRHLGSFLLDSLSIEPESWRGRCSPFLIGTEVYAVVRKRAQRGVRKRERREWERGEEVYIYFSSKARRKCHLLLSLVEAGWGLIGSF